MIAAIAATTAEARTPSAPTRTTQSGKANCRLTRKKGTRKWVRVCKRKVAATKPTASAAPATPSATTPAPVTTAGTGTGAPQPTTPPVVTTGGTEVQAAIGAGFYQNPLAPEEVTWHFSASASRAVTTDGVPTSESVPLPEGELAFFVDGQLDCEIHAVGAISGSACSVDLKALGAHEVSAVFQGAGSLSSTAVRTDYVGRYPTATNVEVSVEPTAPEYLFIGDNKYGFEQHGWEVGRLRITGDTSPTGYPVFDCEGLSSGCLEPEASLKSHNGSVSIPLYAKHGLNTATGLEEWHVAFEATDPALRESGLFWQFPEESVGAQFFHAVSEPTGGLYEPSSTTVPLNLNGGHYPFIRWLKEGEAGPAINAVEGVAQKVLTVGTYEKFDGPEEWLRVQGTFHTPKSEAEQCVYRLRIDGQDMNEDRRTSTVGFEFLNGWPGFSAGPHTLEIWVERHAGAGPGECVITTGTLEAYEVMH